MRRHGAEVRACGCEPADLERVAGWSPSAWRWRAATAPSAPSRSSRAASASRSRSSPPAPPTTSPAPAGCRPTPRRPASWPRPATSCAPMELGRLADGRPFVNVASAGLASAAARRAEPLKPFLGPLAYPSARCAPRPPSSRCAARSAPDGEQVFDGEAWQAIVAVTGAFGGGSEIGAADPEDGGLDVAVAPRRLAPRARPPRLGAAPRHDRRAARRLPRARDRRRGRTAARAPSSTSTARCATRAWSASPSSTTPIELVVG